MLVTVGQLLGAALFVVGAWVAGVGFGLAAAGVVLVALSWAAADE